MTQEQRDKIAKLAALAQMRRIVCAQLAAADTIDPSGYSLSRVELADAVWALDEAIGEVNK